jgi:hypothetical protein
MGTFSEPELVTDGCGEGDTGLFVGLTAGVVAGVVGLDAGRVGRRLGVAWPLRDGDGDGAGEEETPYGAGSGAAVGTGLPDGFAGAVGLTEVLGRSAGVPGEP